MVGLASLVQQELQRDPFSGIMFVFRCKRADRIKLLLWDGTGLVLVTKRLETGTFRWPRFGDGVMSLTAAQASALIEGLDWARVHAPRVASGDGVVGRENDSSGRRKRAENREIVNLSAP